MKMEADLFAVAHRIDQLLREILRVGGHETDAFQPFDFINLAQKLGKRHRLLEILSWLKEHSIKVAVATSTTRRVAEGYWKQSGIDQYIDASVCGDEVVNSKPDPEIFLKAASLLQVPIAECMVAEDSINGLKAARASGAVSCMIPDLTPYTEELAPICDHVSPSLLDCRKIILDSQEK